MDLPDKSGKAPAKKQVKPLISHAEEVKRPATRRLLDSIIQESPKAVAGRVATTVIVPRLKSVIQEAALSALDGILWSKGGRPNVGQTISGQVVRGGIAYSQQSTQSALEKARLASPQVNSGYRDLEMPTLQDAETLLAGMYELLNEYRVVAVGDLYEMANRTAMPSDNAIGWRSLDGARISAVKNGYVLELPRPVQI